MDTPKTVKRDCAAEGGERAGGSQGYDGLLRYGIEQL